jgi:two-component system, OmpR family, alkaline phosphatase synthesis response regulator PhoP
MELNSLTSAPEAGKLEAEANVYDDGRLRVEHDNYYVTCGGQALRLPRKEFLLLSRLARNPQRIVASTELWRYAWPPAVALNAGSLHVHIYRLRRRLSPFGLHIETMVNVGYRLVAANDEGGTINAE